MSSQQKHTPLRSLKEWTEKLDLQPHPEGGFYKEHYRASHTVINQNNKERSASTAIYYALRDIDQSSFHQIQSDELWHFYDGNVTLRIYGIEPVSGSMQTWDLGPEGDLTALIPAKYWFGVLPLNDTDESSDNNNNDQTESHSFALCGCTVAPGFDFEDFQMASRTTLLQAFPEHKEIIDKLTAVPEDRSE
eukprot:CAMPEP_0117448718 /NCGR_PEP_ID=MMETSP0759-20121206/7553_1 /TAXON_ID=63605 /ORGANISM="Percolomonas cosmopolitus, Strain WS" /LENGTH=190 /DNA_ID=CAMNT_0005241129 /DNA_START=121 /DNA_END=693 /DNA_ORIENTATION=+